MHRTVLLLLFAARVKAEPKSFQHEYYVSRQSRDNSEPLQTGYVISRTDNNPASFQSLANHGKSTSLEGGVKIRSDISNKPLIENDSEHLSQSLMSKFTNMPKMHSEPFKMIQSVGNIVFTGATESIMPYATQPWGKHSMDYEIAKAKSKLSIDPISIKADKEYMKDNVAKIEQYRPPAYSTESIQSAYDFDRQFHIDDDDVKTLTGNTLEWWPYFLHSPYEYENMRLDSHLEKPKEKRYAITSKERIIPVHEHPEDYSHVYGARHIEPSYDRSVGVSSGADNPIAGDAGFISFVVKDFSNAYDNDPLELSWRSAFDTNDNIRDNIGKRNRRLDDYSHINDQKDTGTKIDKSAIASRDSGHEKSYEKKHEFDKHESGDSKSNNHNTDRAKSKNNVSGFKDVVDQFANRYGGEDHKRHSAFAFKSNKDSSEKKKGFRRVYHKDEYQEDNEFYDNTNNSAKAEDSGSSIANLGGSIAAIQSHAAAAAGNKADAFNEVENTRKNQFENNHRGHNSNKGLDRDLKRYRDLTRNTASDDYTYFNL